MKKEQSFINIFTK